MQLRENDVHKRGSIGIQIKGGSDCHVDNCVFSGLGTAIDIDGGDRTRVTHSNFKKNNIDISIRGGAGHKLSNNIFQGRVPSREEGLPIIRQRLCLDALPDREILASLHAVLSEHDAKRKRDVARKSTLGKWLIDHGADVNIAVNTLVTLAAAVAQWFR
jgi:hypothetical protein